VIALGKSSYARCFSGDTRVALADGTAPTIEWMAERSREGELFFGYSLGPNGQMIVSLLDAPRFVGRDSLIEVVLDDGEIVHATPDHEFMLRDGSWSAAEDLRVGTALMPLHRAHFRGYEMTYRPLTGTYEATHRMADAWNLRHGIYEDAPMTHRHHVDHDRRNNNPWNIVRMDATAHLRHHNRSHLDEGFDAAEHSAAIKAAFERRRQDDDWNAHMSSIQRRRARDFWNEPEYAPRREALLRAHKERWTDAERNAQRQRQHSFWTDNDAGRREQGARSKRAWASASEARRDRQREIAGELRLRPEIDRATVRRALDAAGSIRGAARLLGCDRSVFRRFHEEVSAFRGTRPESYRNHEVASITPMKGDHDVYCLTAPEAGNFALEAGIFVANCGIVANVTPLEPGWEGHVTLELSNTTPLPAKVYANEGIVQLLFFQGDRPEVTYRDRKGKYQGQRGVTLPRM
jgi:hypothetical protein